MQTDLTSRKCVPCEGGVPKLSLERAREMLEQIPGWQLRGEKVCRVFVLPDYRSTLEFVNRIADLAEEEGHHPDLHVYWGKVDVEIWTHAIGGLSDNDFILAAKIDRLPRKTKGKSL